MTFDLDNDHTKLPNYQRKYNAFLYRLGKNIRIQKCVIFKACIGEFLGTATLVFFGLASVVQRAMGNKLHHWGAPFLMAPVGWGIGVTLGVIVAGRLGSGLINPALTLAYAIVGRIPWIRVAPYALAQLLGAMTACLLVIANYNRQIQQYEDLNSGGQWLMNSTGRLFVSYSTFHHGYCFMDSMTLSALLGALASSIGDKNNFAEPGQLLAWHIGLLIAGLVASFTTNTIATLNPARDLGPRIVLSFVGYGADAFRNNNYYFWIPIVAPYVGISLGAILYRLTISYHLPEPPPENEATEPAYGLVEDFSGDEDYDDDDGYDQ